MAIQNSRLKLTVRTLNYEDEHDDTPSYGLTIANTGSVEESVISVGYQVGSRSEKVPIETPRIMGHISIPSGEDYSLRVSVGHHHNPSFYLETKSGVIVYATKRDRKIECRLALMKLSKRMNPRHKPLKPALAISLFAGISLVILISAVWVGIITHDRATYLALGSITISPVDAPTKYYTLKVGSLTEAAKKDGSTDTIYVHNSASHWYSMSNHKVYSVTTATWPNGQLLKLSDITVDPIHHQAYLLGGCTITGISVRVKCAGDDGKLYYVGIESIGPSLISQLN